MTAPHRRALRAALLTSALAAQLAAQEPQTPPFLRYVPADFDTVIHLSDPVPQIERLMGSKRLENLMKAPGFGGVARLHYGVDANPRAVAGAVGVARAFIPSGVTIAASTAAVRGFAELLRMGALLMALESAATVNTVLQATVVPRLQRQLIDALGQLAAIQLVCLVEVRSDQVAERWFDSAAEAAAALEGTDGVALRFGSDRIDVTLGLSEIDGFDDDVLRSVLVELRALSSASDPMFPRLAAAVRGLELHASLALVDEGLLLTVGRPDTSRTRQSLDPLWKADPDGILFAQWQVGSALEPLREFAALRELWQGTVLESRIRQQDTEDMLGTIDVLRGVLETASVSGALRLAAGEHVEFEAHETLQREHEDLRRSGLLDLVPPDCLATLVDSTRSLADVLADQLGNIEDRLSRNELKALFSDDEDEADRAAARTAAYYEKFGTVRKLLLEDASTVFAPTCGMLVSLDGTLRVTGFGERPRVLELAVPGLAAIGKIRSERGVRQLFEALGKAVAELTGGGPGAFGGEVDLGLGVPTFAGCEALIPAAWRDHLQPFGGDVVPHVFTTGELCVFSTSVALSAKILERARAAAAPAPEDAGPRLVYSFSTTGADVARLLRHTTLAAGEIADRLAADRVIPALPWRSEVDRVTQMCIEALQRVGPIRVRSTEADGVRSTRGELRFVTPDPLPEAAAVLARARTASGPRAADGTALVAEGSCRYLGSDGTFELSVAPDGRFRFEVHGDKNADTRFDGRTATASFDGRPRYGIGLEELEIMRWFAPFVTGDWLREGALVRAECRSSADGIPTMIAALAESVFDARVTFDRDTGLPRHFDLLGERLLQPGRDRACWLSDYRPVGARQLPHLIRYDDGLRASNEYRVERWSTRSAAEIAFAADLEPFADTAFSGDAGADADLRVLENGALVVEPRVNGETPGWFVLDPGMGLWIDSRAAAAVGADVGEKEPGSRVRLETLELGPLTIAKPELQQIRVDPRWSTEKYRVAGFLGQDLFRRCLVEIDVAAGALRLHRDAESIGAPLAWTPMPVAFGQPWVPVVLDGHEGMFRLVANTEMPLGVFPGFALAHGYIAPETLRGHENPALRVRAVTVGGVELDRPPVGLHRHAEDVGTLTRHAGITGLSAFDGWRVVIDLRRQRLALLPPR